MRQTQSLILSCVNEEPWALGREGRPAWEGDALAGNQAHSGLAGEWGWRLSVGWLRGWSGARVSAVKLGRRDGGLRDLLGTEADRGHSSVQRVRKRKAFVWLSGFDFALRRSSSDFGVLRGT